MKILRLIEKHPNGRLFRLLKPFGFWYCEDCKKLHSPFETIYIVRDNDYVCKKGGTKK